MEIENTENFNDNNNNNFDVFSDGSDEKLVYPKVEIKNYFLDFADFDLI
jgi:hypothetical protein